MSSNKFGESILVFKCNECGFIFYGAFGSNIKSWECVNCKGMASVCEMEDLAEIEDLKAYNEEIQSKCSKKAKLIHGIGYPIHSNKKGCSVTQRVKSIKQPRGGFVSPKLFSCTFLEDGIELYANENINPVLIGMAVDYLTRFTIDSNPTDAFGISLLGSEIINQEEKADTLLKNITGLDDFSIINACKLAGYDVCYRVGAEYFIPIEAINPDAFTIGNIRTMVNRSVCFLDRYGPIVKKGFTFDGGYTDIISYGDGDFLTYNTLFDFKVSKLALKSTHTLQLLIYYLMGVHSIYEEFNTIRNIGIFNPRPNCVYVLDVSNIPEEVIREVSSNVIGYQD